MSIASKKLEQRKVSVGDLDNALEAFRNEMTTHFLNAEKQSLKLGDQLNKTNGNVIQLNEKINELTTGLPSRDSWQSFIDDTKAARKLSQWVSDFIQASRKKIVNLLIATTVGIAFILTIELTQWVKDYLMKGGV